MNIVLAKKENTQKVKKITGDVSVVKDIVILEQFQFNPPPLGTDQGNKKMKNKIKKYNPIKTIKKWLDDFS